MVRRSWLTGGSVEATLELWASSLRTVKERGGLNGAQLSAEILPGHDRVQDNQRVVLGIETAIALAEIEETGLTHSCPSLQSQQATLHPNRALGKGQFFEVPIVADTRYVRVW